MKPRAYSYIRFSTPQQVKGSSLKRQLEKSQKYVKEHNLELDETLRDTGLSAYKGDHIKKGALGSFLSLVRAEKIPENSILLVESLDRISRDKVLDAFDLFREIIKHKIKIVTLQDGMTYSEENLNTNIGQLMISLTIMSRSYEESKTKSDRLKKAWEIKRKNIKFKKLTAISPAWLKYNHQKNDFEIITKRANIIKKIFQWSADGIGMATIAKRLNEERIKSFQSKNGWYKSYIQKTLYNRSVLGEFQPHKFKDRKRIPDGEPIPDYYPQIISHKLFNRVHDRLKIVGKTGGGRTGKISNLFGLISKCGFCNSSMRLINKGNTPKGGKYLTCSNAKRGLDCKYILIKYDLIEHHFFKFAYDLDISNIIDDEEKTVTETKIQTLENDLAEIKNNIEKSNKRINNLYNAMSDEDSKELTKGIKLKLQEQLDLITKYEKRKKSIKQEINKLI